MKFFRSRLWAANRAPRKSASLNFSAWTIVPIAPSSTRIRSESSFSNNWRVWTWAMTAMRDCVCVTCYWEKDLAARVRVRADCGTWRGNDVDRCCEPSMANDFTTIAHNPRTCKLA